MDEKIYTPTVIPETPFPLSDQSVIAPASQSSANATYSPATTQEQSFPTKRIAVDTISNVLNTRTRKIIKEFQFTPSGAIQVGEYETGVSGDIRISPDGITARDITGSTTFALDGETGDAVFAGTLQTGALVAGQVAVGDDAIQIDGENRRIIFYDPSGIPSIIIGEA